MNKETEIKEPELKNEIVMACVQVLETTPNGYFETLSWLPVANAIDLLYKECNTHHIKHIKNNRTDKGFVEFSDSAMVTFSPVWKSDCLIMLEINGKQCNWSWNCQQIYSSLLDNGILKQKPRTFIEWKLKEVEALV